MGEESDSHLPDEEDLVALGRITRTQGNRGALRLFPYFEPVTRFEMLRTSELFARREADRDSSIATAGTLRTLHVASFSFHQQYVILFFDEIPDMNAAEELRGMEVLVRRADLWDLDTNEFLVHELEGFEVVDDATGNPLGRLETVQPGSAHDFLRVRAGERSFLVPMVAEFVRKVDTAGRQVRVSLPEGLDSI